MRNWFHRWKENKLGRIVSLLMLAFLLFAGLVAGTGADLRAASEDDRPEFGSFSELSGRTVSMLTGAPFEESVRERVPDVGGFSYYNNVPDMLLSLRSGKTDAALANNATAQLAVNRDENLTLFPEPLQEMVAGFAFKKGDPERAVWQEAFGLIGLVKSTAIVGYVAVQDLTKMGDIVRSRTYEAFFPLIAVAIIYFILSAILVMLIDRFTRHKLVVRI